MSFDTTVNCLTTEGTDTQVKNVCIILADANSNFKILILKHQKVYQKLTNSSDLRPLNPPPAQPQEN